MLSILFKLSKRLFCSLIILFVMLSCSQHTNNETGTEARQVDTIYVHDSAQESSVSNHTSESASSSSENDAIACDQHSDEVPTESEEWEPQKHIVQCNVCSGTGRCGGCGGSGMIYSFGDWVSCSACGGSGACGYCHGNGMVEEIAGW